MSAVDAMTAAELADLDPGIRDTVVWLRMHGFETIDSGDGTKAATMECALDVPNVAMRVPPAILVREANRLFGLLRDEGVAVAAFGSDVGVEIQASYDPADGSALILLLGYVR